MAWNSIITWANGQRPGATDFNSWGLDVRTWGGNVDAGGNQLVNTSAIAVGGSPLSGRALSLLGSTALVGAVLSTDSQAWYIDNRGQSDAPHDRLTISMGGGDMLTVLTSGRVGVGIANPPIQLTVAGSTAVQAELLRLQSTDNNDAGISLYCNGATSMRNWMMACNYTTAGDLCFLASSSPTSVPGFTFLELLISGGVVIPSLPTSNPGSGTKQIWADASDSFRVKYAN